MSQLPRVMYVTHPMEDFSKLDWISKLKDGGVNWIQLRIKEDDLYEHHPDLHFKATFHEIAELVREKTRGLDMILTINDEIDVARFSNANGIHVGMTDSISDNDYEEFELVGGSTNRIEDFAAYNLDKLSYIGVGPLRQTTTKKNTKQALGIEGYAAFIKAMPIDLPVYAIGGVNENDIEELMKAGVYGVAISGLFHHQNFDLKIIRELIQKTKEEWTY